MSRGCQAAGCEAPLDEPWKIMCGPHWHRVPAELQRAINRKGATADQRQRAIEAAIQAVERAEFGGRLL